MTIPWPLPHVTMLTDTDFDDLRLERKIKASQTRKKEKFGHLEHQYELASSGEPDRRYRLYVRQSVSNPDVFSAGLCVLHPDGDILLCRYNSGHHPHRNKIEKQKLPCTFHQHIATARYVAAKLHIDGYAVTRSDYSSIDGALAFLVKECNIHGVTKFNPQIDLLPP